MRITSIDGFRGYFLISMTILHMDYFVNSPLAKLNHSRLGWVEDAQGFVFLSGLVIGLVFGKVLLKKSWDQLNTKMWTRISTLYVYHALLIAFITVLAVTIYAEVFAFDHLWGDLPVLYGVLSVLLLAGPSFIDILPMYIVFMAFTPLVLLQLARERYVAVIAMSFAIWVLAQTGLPTLVLSLVSRTTGLTGHGMELGLYFNRLGWQVIYFIGLAIGMKMAENKLDLSAIKSATGYALFLISTAVFILFAITRLEHHVLVMAGLDALVAPLDVLYERPDLSPLRLINFAADVYMVTWLLLFGATHHWTGPIASVLGAVTRWRPLVFLGQHSLQVYAFHVFVVYAYGFLIRNIFPPTTLINQGLTFAGAIAALYVPAAIHDQWQRRKKAGLTHQAA